MGKLPKDAWKMFWYRYDLRKMYQDGLLNGDVGAEFNFEDLNKLKIHDPDVVQAITDARKSQKNPKDCDACNVGYVGNDYVIWHFNKDREDLSAPPLLPRSASI